MNLSDVSKPGLSAKAVFRSAGVLVVLAWYRARPFISTAGCRVKNRSDTTVGFDTHVSKNAAGDKKMRHGRQFILLLSRGIALYH